MARARTYSARMRARRFRRLLELTADLPKPLSILDVGGTHAFWEAGGWASHPDYRITLLNLVSEEPQHENIVSVQGTATDLGAYGDDSFDLAFSNSVIEHVFTLENQERMASEVRRVGRRYWVQTPNYWFPVEPHFHFVGWHWLPESVRVAILRRRRCGWRDRTRDPAAARAHVREVRLMTRGELQRMFPEARIEAERAYGLVKSWIAISGM